MLIFVDEGYVFSLFPSRSSNIWLACGLNIENSNF